MASEEAIRRQSDYVDLNFDVIGTMTTIGDGSFLLSSIGTPGTSDPQVTFGIEQNGIYDPVSQGFQATVTIVPEPSTLALCMAGAAAMLLLRRHRKQAYRAQ